MDSPHALFAELIDYAGLFPPASLPMEAAVSEYCRERSSPFSWMLGRFIVPASRIGELLDALPANETPIALSVIVDANRDPRAWMASAAQTLSGLAAIRAEESRVRIEALEVPLPALLTRRETYDATIGQFSALRAQAKLGDLPAYVEIPRDDRWEELIVPTCAVLARFRLGGKLRCGGTSLEAFPPLEQVARFIAAVTGAGVPFKATAGLHHPVRHVQAETGFPMHGFLNVLAATLLLRAQDDEAARAALAEEDPAAFAFGETDFAWRDRRFDLAQIAAMRGNGFIAYGSCSFEEPIGDLVGMRALEAVA